MFEIRYVALINGPIDETRSKTSIKVAEFFNCTTILDENKYAVENFECARSPLVNVEFEIINR